MNRQASGSPRGLCRIDALALADARGVLHAPGALLLAGGGRHWRLLARGSPREVDAHPDAPRAERLTRARAVLLPGLVNAHAHLDLTHVGALDHDPGEGFAPWVRRIIDLRLQDEGRIGASVRRGVELAKAGGTVAVGDIAGSPRAGLTLAPLRTLRGAGLLGVSYLEFFAIGTGEAAALERLRALLEAHGEELDEASPVRFGLQPHAPNTVSLAAYRRAATLAGEHARPLATHLAESPEEHDFIARARGEQRALLERFEHWDDGLLESIGRGRTPIGHLEGVLALAPWTVAHANDADDRDLEILAAEDTSVVYCPRAAAYFGAETHFGPHRYREMLGAGINVALGTDSIACLPAEASDPEGGGVSILDEMRLLHRRDGTDAATLLEMATINGAVALGLDPALFRFEPGDEIAGVVGIALDEAPGGDPLAAAMGASERAELILGPSTASAGLPVDSVEQE